MPRENLSATQNVLDPIAPCDPSITPIFPVRFAFKPEVLMDIANDYRNTSAEDNMHNEKDYCLRRIRQGFVYIYVPNTVEDLESRTDRPNGYWMVFRYNTSYEDQNSDEMRTDTETLTSGLYQFRMYQWEDGHAAGNWKLDNTRVYPYAFVPEHTTQIEIGYSEHRWPAYYFEEAERNPEFRKHILTPVDLSAEQSKFSAPLRDLDQHVEEFKPTLRDRISDYLISQTGIGMEDKKTVAFCNHSKTRGRIVALHDPMGRLLDINAVSLLVNNTQANFNQEYQYPLVTARAIESVKTHLDGSWNWFKDLWSDRPISEESDQLRQKFIEACDNFTTLQENLVKLHETTFSHQLDYAITKQIDYAQKNGVRGDGSRSDMELIDYTTALLNQAVIDLNSSTVGSEYIVSLYNPDSGKAIAQTYQDNFVLWSRIGGAVQKGAANGLKIAEKAFERFNVVCTTQCLQMAQAIFRHGNIEIQEAFNSVYSVEEWTHKPLTLDEAEKIIRDRRMPRSTVITNQQLTQRNRLTVYAGNRRLTPRNVAVTELDILHVKFKDFDLIPAPGIRDISPNFGKIETAVAGMGAFLSAATIVDVLHKKENAPAGDDIFSQIADNFWVNITVASMSAIDDSYNTGRALIRSNIGQTARTAISSKLFSRFGANTLFRTQSIALGMSQSKAISLVSSGAKALGRFAGHAGVLLSLLQAAAGIAQDNYAKAWGNALIAIGSGVLMIFGATIVGAVIGVILIVIGAVIEYFGSLDPLQQWAKKSFWGSSRNYWGKERVILLEQINIARVIAIPNDRDHLKLLNAFNKELDEFNQIVNQLRLVDIGGKRNSRFKVYLPYLGEGTQVGESLKVNISIEHKADSSWFLSDDYDDVPFDYSIDYKQKLIAVNYAKSIPSAPGYIEEVSVLIEYTPGSKKTMELEQTIYTHKIPLSAFEYRGTPAPDPKIYGWATP